MNKKILGIGILVMFLAAGCASQATVAPTTMMAADTPTAEAMMANPTATSAGMMAESSVTPGAMMAESTQTPQAMMGTAMPGTGAMMTETATTPATMAPSGTAMTDTMMATGTPSAMMMGNDWLGSSFTDVSTGKSFKLSDFSGKTVLVELVDTKSSASLEQQKSIQTLVAGNHSDVMVVSLDISASESMDDLKSHAEMNHFAWSFASASATVAQEIGQTYGSSYTDPANTPLFVIDTKGTVHALPLRLTSLDQINGALAPYLPKM